MNYEVDIDRDGKLDTLIVRANSFEQAEDRALAHLKSERIDADIVSITSA